MTRVGGSVLPCTNFSCSSYRGTLPMMTPPPLGPYSRTIPRDLWCFYEEWLSLMSEVPL